MPVRLLHWNILDGGGRRLDGIGQYVKTGGYDIVTLNELNNIDSAGLAKLGKAWGLPHSALLSLSRYHLGVLSRYPMTPAGEERRRFAHGLLCVRVLGIKLCVTHLNPQDARRRREEARAIVERHVRPESRSRGVLLVGDLNTLSPLDRTDLEAAQLIHTIRSGPYHKQ